MTGDPVDAVTTSAHYADITIVGQTDPDDGRSASGLADAVVLHGGGPVLVWPYAGACHAAAATVMLAWNGSREATRALADALPLLQQARKVIVFGVDRDDGRHIPGADVSTHLAHHGVRAEARHTKTSFGIHIGDVLLSEIGDCGIGLLVMGGYGHHRLRERLFGGVTRDISARDNRAGPDGALADGWNDPCQTAPSVAPLGWSCAPWLGCHARAGAEKEA